MRAARRAPAKDDGFGQAAPNRSGFPLALIAAAFLVCGRPGPLRGPAGGLPASSPGRAPRAVASPERGFVSSEPGKTWEQGLLSGNGTIGASVLEPCPRRDRRLQPQAHVRARARRRSCRPTTGDRLFEIRRLIDRGLYAQASQLAVDVCRAEGLPLPRSAHARLRPADQDGAPTARSADYARVHRFPDRRDDRPLGRRPGRLRAPAVRLAGRRRSPSLPINGPGRGQVSTAAWNSRRGTRSTGGSRPNVNNLATTDRPVVR
ncbi:MAG: hypothetical protein M0C28_40070 [Candidatus Moduliflexus flocculans]|nr:hypothetical protein [Candidatus Moduliflexus flocculans]